MSGSPRNHSLPNDHSNLHLLAIEQRYHSLRRSSEGTPGSLSPCQGLRRVHSSLMSSTMEENVETAESRQSLSMSPRGMLRSTAATLPGDLSLSSAQCYSTRSGSSSPLSDCESSIASCSELVLALEALTIELQQNQLQLESREGGGESEHAQAAEGDATNPSAAAEKKSTLTRNNSGLEAMQEGKGRQSPVKSLTTDSVKINMAEKEKILNECMNQIKALTVTNKSLEKKLLEAEEEISLALAHKAPSRASLKCWPRLRGCVQDLEKKIALNDHYVEPSEIISVLLESERQYVTGLTLLHSHFQQPMRMLASFKPDILSMQQLNALFLNCSELLVLHRVFYEDLVQIPLLPESAQVDKLFEVLECTFPAFGQYSCFLTSNRPQTVQRELRQLKTKPQFEQLLSHCQKNCEGTSLNNLLNLPAERMSDYSELLTHFLNPRIRALPEDASRRTEALIRFLRNLRYDLSEEKSEWDHTLEKIKLLNKLATDGPIPMEIFNSEVRLLKQGTLTQVMGKKEMAKHCILFNNYIALAQTKDNQYKIMENRMIPLQGAQLHKCVDVEGQAIASDLQSGRSEDRLAFGLSLVNSESLYLRAARPNEWKQWVELLEKCIQESQKLHLESVMDVPDYRTLYPVDSGPKIAAASLEKLFQQLTSPHFEHQDFIRVFLLTHGCFTTSEEVLTALLNCIKSPDDNDRMSQGSDSDLFLFNVPMEELSSSDGVSASPSLYTINTDSEMGSPGLSPSVVRRSTASSTHTMSSIMSSSPSPNSLLRTGNSARKAVSSFASTDSEVSPHTSAVVVDNVHIPTKDGWAEAGEPDLTSRKNTVARNLTLVPSIPPGGEGGYYTKLYPTNLVHCVIESEASDLEGDGTEKTTPTITPMTSLDTTGPVRAIRRRIRTLSEGGSSLHSIIGDKDTFKDTMVGIEHSVRMQQELEAASKMMENLTESLDTEFVKRKEEAEEVKVDVVKRRSRSIPSNSRNRLGIISVASTSEPDLSGCGIDEDDIPPALPPRDPDMLLSMTKEEGDLVMRSLYSSRPAHPRMVRRGSEHSLLSCSLNIGPAPITPEKKSKDKKTRTLQRSKKRKADTFSGRGTPTSSVVSSPVRTSSTLYFSSSPSHSGAVGVGLSTSFSGADHKTHKRSKWSNLRNMVNKKLNRSAGGSTLEADENRLRVKPQRSQSIPSTMKCGIYATRSASICGEEAGMCLPDGGSISIGSRKSSVSQANNVNLVSKIFSVLGCWVDEYYEDFEGNTELTQTMSDYLETLIAKATTDTLEYHRAYQLLEALRKKIQYTSTPAPNCPFPILLSRVIRLTPEVLSMYDWANPDKLMKGREIDLSIKNLGKESSCLKMIAEQLTLMEFSVYAVIQRKELLNCNWKKPNKEELSPNLCRLIRRTNDMTSWVATEILQRRTPSQRAVVIEHFIQIANFCYKHNDLHCALNITIALGSACIKSLRLTWNEVDKKYRHRFDKLRDSMDYHGKCKKMRENLEQLTRETLNKTNELPSVLPYIGAYLDVIYTIEMQSKTYNHDGLVNFAKMTKLAEVVTRVLQYQDVGFNFEPKPDLMAYVTASKRLSENDLYELSMTAEPHTC